MVRAPTIRGRPTPARKSSSSSSTLSTSHSAKATIPKALKRAERRAKLLARAPDAENKGARAMLKEGEHSISKSSIRRRKRKARDEIGRNEEQGRDGGVGEIRNVVNDLEMEMKTEEEVIQQKQKAVFESGKITANQRRKLLTQEQARQGVILTDPAYKASPFEALRMHARNTIAGSQ